MSDRAGALGPGRFISPPKSAGSGRALHTEEHMTQDIRIWRLRNRHRWLDQRLREEIRRPAPDALAIQDLKRRKLQVKDELFVAEAGRDFAAA